MLTQSPNSLSAAARVGFSLAPRAGVPVRDLARRVDLPKEPVSAIVRRDRVLGPSFLQRAVVSMLWANMRINGREIALVKDHGVGALDAVVANVAFLIGNVVED